MKKKKLIMLYSVADAIRTELGYEFTVDLILDFYINIYINRIFQRIGFLDIASRQVRKK